jgi:hypothetical protein
VPAFVVTIDSFPTIMTIPNIILCPGKALSIQQLRGLKFFILNKINAPKFIFYTSKYSGWLEVFTRNLEYNFLTKDY